jgi:hypothetical protein
MVQERERAWTKERAGLREREERLRGDLQQAYITAGKLERELEGAREREAGLEAELEKAHAAMGRMRREGSEPRMRPGGGAHSSSSNGSVYGNGSHGHAGAGVHSPGRGTPASSRGTPRRSEVVMGGGVGASPLKSAKRRVDEWGTTGRSGRNAHPSPGGMVVSGERSAGGGRARGYLEREREREGAMRELNDLTDTIGELEHRIAEALTSK